MSKLALDPLNNYVAAGAPSLPRTGDCYFNNVLNSLLIYNGATWDVIQKSLYATAATSVSTVTLTAASAQLQFFTGATAQSVVLPVVTTFPNLGYFYTIVNNSTATITVTASGSGTVATILAGHTWTMNCILLSGTTAASWQARLDGANTITGSGALVFGTSPTFATPAIGTPTSGTLTSCTGLPIAGTTGWGTGVAAALALAVLGSGGIVLGNSPTISAASAATIGLVVKGFASQASDLVEVQTSTAAILSSITAAGLLLQTQNTPNAQTVSTTLTVANLQTRIITSTSASAVSLTLPTGTLMDGGFNTNFTNESFDWNIVNLGSTLGVVTVVAGTAHTIVGSATVAINTSSMWRSYRTGVTTWVTVRLV